MNLLFEKKFFVENPHIKRIVGIDEVGRGCVAGPVTVCGFSFSVDQNLIDGVNDSKLLTPKKRVELFESLKDIDHKIEFKEATDIDKFGIANCISEMIQNIIDFYNDVTTYFFIDGVFKKDFGQNSKKIIKADSNIYSVAAASILAKVTRDRLMEEYSLEYPKYGLNKHKGYCTKLHLDKIKEFGITNLHRKSFLRNYI